jgi:hypothetical protein
MRSPRKSTGIVAPTTTRVSRHTPDYLNQRIMIRSREHIENCAAYPDRIEARLSSLDREWDIERVLEANASSLVVVGTLLGYLVSAWFYWLPLLVGSFLLQHAIQGWCPPIRLFRRLGFRTHSEIATEYYTLRALRGDFNELAKPEAKDPKEKAEKLFLLLAWPSPARTDETMNPQDDGKPGDSFLGENDIPLMPPNQT